MISRSRYLLIALVLLAAPAAASERLIFSGATFWEYTLFDMLRLPNGELFDARETLVKLSRGIINDQDCFVYDMKAKTVTRYASITPYDLIKTHPEFVTVDLYFDVSLYDPATHFFHLFTADVTEAPDILNAPGKLIYVGRHGLPFQQSYWGDIVSDDGGTTGGGGGGTGGGGSGGGGTGGGGTGGGGTTPPSTTDSDGDGISDAFEARAGTDPDDPDDVPVSVEIYTIQGAGMSSPLAGATALTLDNVVTALTATGFFMQTPSARTDGNAQTSDGIFVFTNAAPGVAVSDRVDVIGDVAETNGLTQIAGSPLIQVASSANPLPVAVVLDATMPSPNQPQADNEFERFEGMRVEFDGIVSGPTDFVGETRVVASVARAYREAGIRYPGIPGLPEWDGNPELFVMDADALGLANELLFGGQSMVSSGLFTSVNNEYRYWPTVLTPDAEPALPRPVPLRQAGEFTVATQYLDALYDTVNDAATADVVNTNAMFVLQLGKISAQIRTVLGAPDVVAMQNVENLTVLEALAQRIRDDDASVDYAAHLIEGGASNGLDIGLLTRSDTVEVHSVTAIGVGMTLTTDGSPLFAQPPLVLEGAYLGDHGKTLIAVLGVQLATRAGIDDLDAALVKARRVEQADYLAAYVQARQSANPYLRLIVAGNFNAHEFSDGYVDVLGKVTGDPDPGGDEANTLDVVDPDLINLTLALPAAERYSHVEQGSAEALDHILTGVPANALVSLVAYTRGNADAPAVYELQPDVALGSSSRDGQVAFLQQPAAGSTDLYARAKSGKASLVWAPVPGAVGYNIYRRTEGEPFALVAADHVTSYATYLDQGLTNGVTYHYLVHWVSVDGVESASSNEVTATPIELVRRR